MCSASSFKISVLSIFCLLLYSYKMTKGNSKAVCVNWVVFTFTSFQWQFWDFFFLIRVAPTTLSSCSIDRVMSLFDQNPEICALKCAFDKISVSVALFCSRDMSTRVDDLKANGPLVYTHLFETVMMLWLTHIHLWMPSKPIHICQNHVNFRFLVKFNWLIFNIAETRNRRVTTLFSRCRKVINCKRLLCSTFWTGHLAQLFSFIVAIIFLEKCNVSWEDVKIFLEVVMYVSKSSRKIWSFSFSGMCHFFLIVLLRWPTWPAPSPTTRREWSWSGWQHLNWKLFALRYDCCFHQLVSNSLLISVVEM